MPLIQVHPMSLGAAANGTVEMQAGAYPLGCLVAYAKAVDGGRLTDHFNFGPITPRYYQDMQPFVDELTEPGIFLFSSYVWNHAGNVIVANSIKQRFPQAFVIFGGPQIPRERGPLKEFFEATECADLVVRGEGEEALAEILSAIARAGVPAEAASTVDFSAILGITYRRSGLQETPDRTRPKSIEAFPSPYTTGLFEHWVQHVGFMPLETNRGCPYGCVFCDWGAATLSKIRPYDIERVFAEVEYFGSRHIGTIYLTDANFGILKRDVDIARRVVEVRERTGYPIFVGYSNAKVFRPELQTITSLFRRAGLNAIGQIAIQTTDQRVLEIANRSNIKMSEYDKLVRFFRDEKMPALSDMMVGLPGENLSTCKKDLQFLFDRRIHARIFPTMVMANAPMASPAYKERYAIRFDADGFVKSTVSFTEEEYREMFNLCSTYKLLGNFGTGLFKYLLLFLQMDLGVRALDFIEAWLTLATRQSARFPASFRLHKEVFSPELSPRAKGILAVKWDKAGGEAVLGDIDAVFREALEVAEVAFGIRTTGTDVDAVLTAQKAVLPSPTSEVGEVSTPHDVAAYFEAIASCVSLESPPPELRPLREYGPGTVRVFESQRELAYDDYMAPFIRLELPSNLSC